MPVALPLQSCLLRPALYSPYVIEEDCRDHDRHARDAEVGEAPTMGFETEVGTLVTTKDAPEQSSQWSHQRLREGGALQGRGVAGEGQMGRNKKKFKLCLHKHS